MRSEKKQSMKKWGGRVFVAGVALLALAVGATLALRHYVPSASPPADASALFALTFTDTQDQPQAMAQWQGNTLVVNFWATWCAPCIEEMPDLQKVQTEYLSRGVKVVGLAIDNEAAVKRFADEMKLQFPLLLAGATGSELIRQLGNPSGAMPFTLLIDQRGRIVQSKLGRLRAIELRAWLDEELKASIRPSVT